MPITLGKDELEWILPHRSMAMPDDFNVILEDDGRSATASKQLPKEDKYFAGHFPNMAILPGHWILEMCAITVATLARKKWDELVKPIWPELVGNPGMPGLYKYDLTHKRPLLPEEKMIIKMELVEVKQILRSPGFIFKGKVFKEERERLRECVHIESLTGVAMIER